MVSTLNRTSKEVLMPSAKLLQACFLERNRVLHVAIATLTLLTLGSDRVAAEFSTKNSATISPTDIHLTDISQSRGVLLMAFDYDLNRAKNLARQRGEAENGGVSVYETEPSMHGPAAESPHVINSDGSVTFTFRGRPRGGDFYTLETQVTVFYDAQTQWDIVTEYNQEIPPTTVSMSDLM